MGWRETVSSRKVSGSFGDSTQYSRSFIVRVSHPATSLAMISRSVGIAYGTPHPEQPDCLALSFDCAPADAVGMFWNLTIKYERPDPAEPIEPDLATGLPKDVWTLSSSTVMAPAMFTAGVSTAIANSAGDPLEGLQYEKEDIAWTLTKCFATLSELTTLKNAASNKLNTTTWMAGTARSWKVNFQSAQKKSIAKTEAGSQAPPPNGQINPGEQIPFEGEETTLSYWESVWTFRHRRGVSGWDLEPWNVGFNEIKSNGDKVAILTDDETPVSQPVALNTDGSAKDPGSAPTALQFEVYEETSFDAFGNPS